MKAVIADLAQHTWFLNKLRWPQWTGMAVSHIWRWVLEPDCFAAMESASDGSYRRTRYSICSFQDIHKRGKTHLYFHIIQWLLYLDFRIWDLGYLAQKEFRVLRMLSKTNFRWSVLSEDRIGCPENWGIKAHCIQCFGHRLFGLLICRTINISHSLSFYSGRCHKKSAFNYPYQVPGFMS